MLKIEIQKETWLNRSKLNMEAEEGEEVDHWGSRGFLSCRRFTTLDSQILTSTGIQEGFWSKEDGGFVSAFSIQKTLAHSPAFLMMEADGQFDLSLIGTILKIGVHVAGECWRVELSSHLNAANWMRDFWMNRQSERERERWMRFEICNWVVSGWSTTVFAVGG